MARRGGRSSPTGDGWARREFLTRLAAGGAGLVVAGRRGWLRTGEGLVAPRPVVMSSLEPTQVAVPMAMHLHASFSEGDASLAAHLSEAAANSIPVACFSDHDWRMSQIGYRQALHFDSLNAEKEGPNPVWILQPQKAGPLAADYAGGIVGDPVSPLDPSPLGALHVRATSTGVLPASYRFVADATKARTNQRANIVGQSWDLEVLALQVGTDAWLELLVSLSYRPAASGRPAGRYQLSYRFGVDPPNRVAQGALGVIVVPVVAGEWTSVHLEPLADIEALWPDIVAEDNATFDFFWGATGQKGATAEGYFDYHRFNRDPAALAGDAPLDLQQRLLARYQPSFPAVSTMEAVEYSYYANHVNGFGPDQHLPGYAAGGRVNPPTDKGFATVISDQVQAAGGVSSYNHPFGTSTGKVVSLDKQNALRHKTTVAMLATRANHANLLEVGYAQRGNLPLAQHLALWDTMWRNGIWLTGVGVTDDHSGHAGAWVTGANRFVTTVWAASTQVGDLLAALKAGRAFCWDLPNFKDGAIDVVVDGVVPMGSVSVRPDLDQRQLTIVALGLPAGGSVQVVRGPVDYAGSSYPDPATQMVATVSDTDLESGTATVPVDTTASCFVRVVALNAVGTVIAVGNPIGLLRAPPPAPVPPERLAPDSA